MKAKFKDYLPTAEFCLRLYVAYFMASYGYAKLTGTMFNNATEKILNTPLNMVDIFHLTWYYYANSKVLSFCIGILQIASAVAMLFEKTVIYACLVALPVMFGVLLVDIDSTAFVRNQLALALVARVAMYVLSITLFLAYRRDTLLVIVKEIANQKFRSSKSISIKLIPIFLLAFFAIELMFVVLANLSSMFFNARF